MHKQQKKKSLAKTTTPITKPTKTIQKRKQHTTKQQRLKKTPNAATPFAPAPMMGAKSPFTFTPQLSLLPQRRKFSTQSPTASQPTTNGETSDDELDAEAHRARFKTIVGTMNADQQMVVQALVTESTMLRSELNNFVNAIQQQEDQLEALTAQLSEVKQDVASQQELYDEVHDTSPYPSLDINSPTYFDDMIEAEQHPRVKASLMRENQLRNEIKPLIDIIDIAANEKEAWKKRSSQHTLAIFALTGLLIGQSVIMWKMGSTEAVHGQSVSGLTGAAEGLNVYLQEAVDIIQQYEHQSKGNTAATQGGEVTTVSPGTKFQLFKEKIRLYNLANPKATIKFNQAIE